MGRSIRKHRPKNPKKKATGPYSDIVRENAQFDEFYRAQEGLCPPEEFEDMLKYMRLDLPASFRITGFRSQALALRDFVQGQYLDQISNLADQREKENATSGETKATEVKEEEANEENETENREIVRPTKLSWYPDGMAWQLNITRKDIRRDEAFFKLHNFLISETESGNISRQETVSMIPPLVLDVKPHHKVLDMCAAPGSKTAQLIEAIHSSVEDDVVPEGLVVANDADNSRCYMLVHQAKRLQSPCLVITNHDASIMPNFVVDNPKTETKEFMKYDRVLCDVPCSGDGTLRKNADIWPRWNPVTSLNLHGVQFRILKRGLEMLEVGGRLVYSTCSLNPLEDEAVIYRMLVEAGDAIELADAAEKVQGLKYSTGISKWKIAMKDGAMYTEFDQVPESLHSQVRPHMFAPSSGVEEKYRLDRCLRILPHQQNTGGFFVAVIQKNKLCPWESGNKQPSAVSKSTENGSNGEDKKDKEPPRKKPKYQGFKEDPFQYFDPNDPAFEEIKKYFDIQGLDATMFLTRCKDRNIKNNLYFTSQLVRNIVMNNEDRVKIINTGVKAFARCENKGADCIYRLAQEGAQMTIPFMKKRIVHPQREDVQVLLLKNDIEMPPDITEMAKSTQEQLQALDTGSIALVYEELDDEGKPRLKLEMVGWKGKKSVRAYVPKQERIHYLRLVGGDTAKFEENKFERRRQGNSKEHIDGRDIAKAKEEAAAAAAKEAENKSETDKKIKTEEAENNLETDTKMKTENAADV